MNAWSIPQGCLVSLNPRGSLPLGFPGQSHFGGPLAKLVGNVLLGDHPLSSWFPDPGWTCCSAPVLSAAAKAAPPWLYATATGQALRQGRMDAGAAGRALHPGGQAVWSRKIRVAFGRASKAETIILAMFCLF
ncbi:hypothetical protein MRX96_032377 [Rhipicephalus microplus]